MKRKTKVLKELDAAAKERSNVGEHQPAEPTQAVDEQPATFRAVVEDPYWTQLEDDVALFMQVTGFDGGCCRSLVLHVYGVMPRGEDSERIFFNSVVSALRDQKPINQLDAKLQLTKDLCAGRGLALRFA